MNRVFALLAAMAVVVAVAPPAGAQPTDEPAPEPTPVTEPSAPSEPPEDSAVPEQPPEPPAAPELPEELPPTIPQGEVTPEPPEDIQEVTSPSSSPLETLRKLRLLPHFTGPVVSRAPVGIPSTNCHGVRSSRKATPGGHSPAVSSRVSC